MELGTLDLTKGKLTLGSAAILQTTSDQLFKKSLGTNGLNPNAQGWKYSEDSIVIEDQGTLRITDALYNENYVKSVQQIVGETTQISFAGKLAEAVDGKQSLDSLDESTSVIHEQTTATLSGNGQQQATVDKSVGVKALEITDENVKTVSVAQGKQLTLVGGNADEEVIAFKAEDGTSVTVDGTVNLGAKSSTTNAGKLSSEVTLASGGTLAVQAGNFTVANVTANAGSKIASVNGAGTFQTVTLNGGSLEATGEKATQVDELHVADTSTLTGSVNTKLTGSDTAVLNVGSANSDTSAKADLVLHEDSALNGMIIFIDPAWKDNAMAEDASRLVFKSKEVDGRIVAGQNSYAVLGTDNDQEFLKLFANKTLTWGEKDTGAALFVGAPIALNAEKGALQADATLTQAPTNLDVGSLILGTNSVLVADMSQYTEDTKALITGVTNLSVDSSAKAVIVGQLKNKQVYNLTDMTNPNSGWSEDGQLIAANKMWKLTVDYYGNSFTTELIDAKQIYVMAI